MKKLLVRLIVTLLTALLYGCMAGGDVQENIGEASMLEDGTIILRLRAEHGHIIGDALFEYKPGSDFYEAIKKHLDPIAPGDRKLVPPWPSE